MVLHWNDHVLLCELQAPLSSSKEISVRFLKPFDNTYWKSYPGIFPVSKPPTWLTPS